MMNTDCQQTLFLSFLILSDVFMIILSIAEVIHYPEIPSFHYAVTEKQGEEGEDLNDIFHHRLTITAWLSWANQTNANDVENVKSHA